MKALVCEMCNGQDLVKQDGMYVCQSCGTKYSPDEARKLMIEGTVDVKGTVKVDNSAFVEKYLANARRALEKTDWEEVEKYYNLVEQNAPQNIEAVFYSSYGKAMLSLTEDSDPYKREQRFDVFCKSESVIDDYYDIGKSEELKPIIQGMSRDLIKMTESKFVFNTTRTDNTASNDAYLTYKMFAKAEIQFIESIENIVAKDEQPYLYEILLTHYSRCIQKVSVDNQLQVEYQGKMANVNKRMGELNPAFEAVPIPEAKVIKSGCYVATAVYGSYDCPEVWTLRRYRDYTLSESWYGRAFIRSYYAVSPTLVKWFGKTEWFKKMWKPKLDRMVARLHQEGVEDTPYQDRNW